jgi:hypothetical protein
MKISNAPRKRLDQSPTGANELAARCNHGEQALMSTAGSRLRDSGEGTGGEQLGCYALVCSCEVLLTCFVHGRSVVAGSFGMVCMYMQYSTYSHTNLIYTGMTGC